MKLKDFQQKNNTNRLIGLYESQFGEKIVIPKNKRSLHQLATKINENINQFKQTSLFHTSQQQPAYLKMLAVRDIVETAINEYSAGGTTSTTGTTTTTGTVASGAPISQLELQKRAQRVRDPRMKQMLQKAASGENMDKEEVKRLADLASKDVINETDDEYRVEHEKEDDLWVVKDSLGNWIEPFVEKIDAMRALRKYKTQPPKNTKIVHHRAERDLGETSCGKMSKKYKTNEIAPLAGMAARAAGGAIANSLSNSGTTESDESDSTDSDKKVEAHGARGVKSRPWRKVFKNAKHFEKWLEKYEDELEVHGVRELSESVITESEIQSAQVVLAAQDLVDQVQKMIENASESQFKDLPALAAQIKLDQDSEKSNRFYQIANEAFGEIISNLQATKSKLEEAMGVLTGETTTDFDFDNDRKEMPKKSKISKSPSDSDIDLDLEKETNDVTGFGRERR